MLNFGANAYPYSSEGPSGGRDEGKNVAEDAEGETGRVLRFDPTLRQRKGARGKDAKTDGSKKSFYGTARSSPQDSDERMAGISGGGHEASARGGAGRHRPDASRVRSSHSVRFKVFRVLEILGVVFALVVVLRTCGF